MEAELFLQQNDLGKNALLLMTIMQKFIGALRGGETLEEVTLDGGDFAMDQLQNGIIIFTPIAFSPGFIHEIGDKLSTCKVFVSATGKCEGRNELKIPFTPVMGGEI